MKSFMATKTEAYVDTSALIAFLDRSDSYHALLRRLAIPYPPAGLLGLECIIRGKANSTRRNSMAGTYKITELVGTSPTSFAEATKAAVAEAAKTVRNMEWFQVVEERGKIKDGVVAEFQVTLKIGFRIER
jgi:hypothetical protein